jgi:hypothetical protein
VLTESEQTSAVRGIIVFQKPDKFRLEILPRSATYTLTLLVAREGLATLLDPREKSAVVSSSASGLLQAALKLPMSESDLMSYFLARVPPRFAARVSNQKEALVATDSQTGRVTVRVTGTGDTWTIDAGTGLLTEATLINRFDELTDVELSFAGTLLCEGLQLPGVISVKLPRQNLAMTFTLVTTKCNQDIPDTLFSAEIPADYSVIKK